MPATVVLDQQQRNGTFDTASIAVRADAVFLNLGSTMADADALDTSKRCLLRVSVSYDGVAYAPAGSSEWAGGTDRFGNPNLPRMGVSVPLLPDGTRPTRAMARIDTEGNLLNLGVTLEAV